MGGFYRDQNGAGSRQGRSPDTLAGKSVAAVQIRNTWLINKGGVSSSPSGERFVEDVATNRAGLGGNLMLIHNPPATKVSHLEAECVMQ
jgi:hypothetical protein